MNIVEPNLFGVRGALSLLGAAGVVVVILLVVWREIGRVRLNKQLQLPSRLGRARLLVLVGTTVCLAFGIFRPYWGVEELQVPRVGRDIMVVLDVSHSMQAEDVAPNRLGVAQRKIYDLLDLVRAESPGDRVGLVLFAGESYLYCPLTADYGVVRVFVDAVNRDLINTPGSVLGEAISTALEAFRAAKASARRLVVFTDGEDSSLERSQVIQILKDHRLRPGFIGVGTTAGTVLPPRHGRPLYDDQGLPVQSALQETALQELAAGADGRYQRASLDARDLRAILALQDGLTERAAGTQSESLRHYHEIGAFFALLPLCVWMGLSLFRAERWMLPLFLIVGSTLVASLANADEVQDATAAGAPTPTPVSVYEARQRLDAGDVETALRSFKGAYELNPEDSAVRDAYGASLYRGKQFTEAAKVWRGLDAPGATTRERYIGRYNAGNALLAAEDYPGAIAEYDRALTYKPNDEAAMENRRLAYLKQEQRPTPTPTPTPEGSPSAEPSPSGSPSPSPTADGTTTPEGSPSPGGSPTPNNSPNPTPGNGSPTPEGTSTPTGKETPSDATTPTPNGSPSPAARPTPRDGKPELTEAEVRAWLDSLPDAPVLLQRHGSQRPRGGQEW